MIFVLLALLAVTGVVWFITWPRVPPERIPYDNTYKWTEIFRGYEAYLDKRISYFTISGPSMEPTFGDGDVVLWVEVDNKAELKVDDIVVYEHPTMPDHPLIVHRIIEVGTENGRCWFRMQGDNNPEPDRYGVWEEAVKGLVIGVIYSAPPE